ncbi:hypothetical protein CEUSTIGMA_g11608.t1 [Chlamydomonas eustigma]|uniref:Ubiquinone biosynthesis protein COQ4 homolog, mitochondrial n=1 Tax=Chlamydomonas eustigma TaxID=1157962 RepID=A0A250XM60_9CHLO|nr:hypothetical protein CEUSTIGMA_g11608.t1 [Chlamydomonas eustigma]|eukprot:GAX84185.1 hypothetical protein CEUSTIGMA_g11608.t1 [Chlamydomonas eustigma]
MSVKGILYPTHVPLNLLQKSTVAIFSSIGALISPERADLVASVAETTGTGALQQLRDRMRKDSEGQRVLEDRPRITNATMALCSDLPKDTFGGAYLKFMRERNFEADDRPPVRFVDDEELAYVLTRMREVHDFWHVMFGCNTDVLGELAIKSLEFVQTGVPMTGLAVLGAQYRLSTKDRELLRRFYMPWAYRAGCRAKDLLSIYYEEHLQMTLVDFRQAVRVIPAPMQQ